jgi:hypothetical protein
MYVLIGRGMAIDEAERRYGVDESTISFIEKNTCKVRINVTLINVRVTILVVVKQ